MNNKREKTKWENGPTKPNQVMLLPNLVIPLTHKEGLLKMFLSYQSIQQTDDLFYQYLFFLTNLFS